MLKIEHASLAIAALDHDSEIEIIEGFVAALNAGIHGKVKVPQGALTGARTCVPSGAV